MKFDGKPRLTAEEEALNKKPVLGVIQIIDEVSKD
jgi:hypothetical protein